MLSRNGATSQSRAVIVAAALTAVAACSDVPTSVPDFNREPLPTDIAAAYAAAATYASTGKFSALYYGNWCGPSWSGGSSRREPPIDQMDVACQTHDRDYVIADSYWGQQYRTAKTKALRAAACTSWRYNYFNANNALMSAAAVLPAKSALEKSMKAKETPDVWGFDSRIFGPHPRTAAQRVVFRDAVIAVRLTGLFKDPPCSAR